MYGDRIATLRKQRHMSRAALGAAMGVSTTAVYKWENQISQPDIPMLQKLAEFFGVTVDSLLDHQTDYSGAAYSELVVHRAIRRMTPEEQQKYLEIGRVLFTHAFAETDTGTEKDTQT